MSNNNTIQDNLIRLNSAKTNIASAITNKGVTVPSGSGFEDFPQLINNIPTGGGEEMQDAVRIFDYDGTILHQYSKSQFLALSEYPEHPDRTSEGLTSDGYNWSFQEAQDYVRTYGMLEIGAMYYPTSGRTEIHIEIPTTATTTALRTFKLQGYCAVANTTYIDWGDETTTKVNTSTATTTTYEHTYNNSGNYIISIYCTDRTNNANVSYFGSNSSSSSTAISPNTDAIKRYIKRIYYHCSTDIGECLLTTLGIYGVVVPFVISSKVYVEGASYSPVCVCMNATTHLNLKSAMYISKYSTNSKVLTLSDSRVHSSGGGYVSNNSATGTIERITLKDNYISSTYSASSANYVPVYTQYMIVPPDGLANLNLYTFAGMKKLDLTYMNQTMNSIGLYGSYIREIIVGPNVKPPSNTSENAGFGSVNKLKFLSNTPNTGIKRLLGTVQNWCKIYIPQGSLSDYMSATSLSADYFIEYETES